MLGVIRRGVDEDAELHAAHHPVQIAVAGRLSASARTLMAQSCAAAWPVFDAEIRAQLAHIFECAVGAIGTWPEMNTRLPLMV